MLCRYLRTAGKIGNGASHLENATIGSRTQRTLLHGKTKHLKSVFIGFGILMYHLVGHLSVAVHTVYAFETFALYIARRHNPFAYVSR